VDKRDTRVGRKRVSRLRWILAAVAMMAAAARAQAQGSRRMMPQVVPTTLVIEKS